MIHGESPGVLLGAVVLGAIHGVEPGHGWPVAASYALDQSHKWGYGLAASLIIGVGHLVSSITMVAVFFYAKAYFELTQINNPVTLLGTFEIGGPVSIVAGLLLIWLGIREYRHGYIRATGHNDPIGEERDQSDHHGHTHHHAHDTVTGHENHQSDHHGHSHQRDTDASGLWLRVRSALPGLTADSQWDGDRTDDRGLLSIAWFALVLGFAHEEEFEIIALCAGSTHCLELMGAYALTVIAGIVGLTLLLIAGYQHYEQRVERYSVYLPLFSALVLTVMGIGFVVGVL